MKLVEMAPNAAAMINSMRAIGYSFESAMADIIDNSLAASSTIVNIEIRKDPTFVSFVDNGIGMSPDTLLTAMRLGSMSPLEIRADGDHGRFGLGLKTASLSQCRRLTVISKRDGIASAARWDLNVVESTNLWNLQILDETEFEAAPRFESLKKLSSGTLVIWETFDRIAPRLKSDLGDTLAQIVHESAEHMAFVFHRFIDGSAGRRVSILVNGAALEPADPFLLRNSYTRKIGSEEAILGGSKISATAYLLPHFNQITARELQSAGGASRMREHQGFFVYRNFRLISFGTWFRLATKEELTRLARIQVDIDNSADHLWNLDIKKASVYPPHNARHFLSLMVGYVTNESVRRFKPVRSAQADEQAAIWLRKPTRDLVHFEINRTHPIVAQCIKNQPSDGQIAAMLDAIELALPVRQLYFDAATSEHIEFDDPGVKSRLRQILSVMLGQLSKKEKDQLAVDVAHLEPFRSYPEMTKSLLEEFYA